MSGPCHPTAQLHAPSKYLLLTAHANHQICKRRSYTPSGGGPLASVDTAGQHFVNATHRLRRRPPGFVNGPAPPRAPTAVHALSAPLQPGETETALCVANVDTATALRVLTQHGLHPVSIAVVVVVVVVVVVDVVRRGAGSPTLLLLPTKVGLNFANAHHAGGGYLRGARAQEEDLCRLMPTLYTALKRLDYPLAEDQAHYSL